MGDRFPSPSEVTGHGLAPEELEKLIEGLINRVIKNFEQNNRGRAPNSLLRGEAKLTSAELRTFHSSPEEIRRAQDMVGPEWDLQIFTEITFSTRDRHDPGPTGSQVRHEPHASIGVPNK